MSDSLVITPTYNEKENIEKELKEISNTVASLQFWVEQMIADGKIDQMDVETLRSYIAGGYIKELPHTCGTYTVTIKEINKDENCTYRLRQNGPYDRGDSIESRA